MVVASFLPQWISITCGVGFLRLLLLPVPIMEPPLSSICRSFLSSHVPSVFNFLPELCRSQLHKDLVFLYDIECHFPVLLLFLLLPLIVVLVVAPSSSVLPLPPRVMLLSVGVVIAVLFVGAVACRAAFFFVLLLVMDFIVVVFSV